MRCLACNEALSDKEASRKYVNHQEMPENEDRYIGLCDNCLIDTDLNYIENPTASNKKGTEEYDIYFDFSGETENIQT